MTALERDFLEKYYKALYSSRAMDWFDAACSAKYMYNESRADPEEEAAIQIAAALNAD